MLIIYSHENWIFIRTKLHTHIWIGAFLCFVHCSMLHKCNAKPNPTNSRYTHEHTLIFQRDLLAVYTPQIFQFEKLRKSHTLHISLTFLHTLKKTGCFSHVLEKCPPPTSCKTKTSWNFESGLLLPGLTYYCHIYMKHLLIGCVYKRSHSHEWSALIPYVFSISVSHIVLKKKTLSVDGERQ